MELVEVVPVTICAVVAFWSMNPVMLIIAGAVGIFTGFSYYDNYVSNIGLVMGICLVIFGLVCWGMAFYEMTHRRRRDIE